MTDMGWDFKVPKQADGEQWKKVEMLAANGVTFRWRIEQRHEGPGPRPARLRDVKAFLKARNEEKNRPE